MKLNELIGATEKKELIDGIRGLDDLVSTFEEYEGGREFSSRLLGEKAAVLLKHGPRYGILIRRTTEVEK